MARILQYGNEIMEYDYETRSVEGHRKWECLHCGLRTFTGNVFALNGINETHRRSFDGTQWLDNCPGVGKLEEVL